MKKITTGILLFVCLLLCVFPQFACGKKNTEDATIKASAEDVIKKSEMVRRLFYIEGLPKKEGAVAVDGYVPVDMEALVAINPTYTSLEKIFDSMQGIWSDAYCEAYRKRVIFTSEDVDNKRYCFDKYHDETKEYEGIWVREEDFKSLAHATDPVAYMYDTIEVAETLAGQARLTITVKVTDRQDNTKSLTKKMNIYMSRDTDSGKWLLDSGLVAKYFEVDRV